MTAAAIAREAVAALGGDCVRLPTEPCELVDGTAPSVVVAPTDAAGVAAALGWAQAAGLAVVVRGRGTKDAWGGPPGRIDVLLSLARMNRVIAHEAGDLTATLEAGARLSDVNRVLRARGQRLPVDPPEGADATIGGILATNDTGPLRHRFGTPRDLVLGMSIATSAGELAASGGRVVKNVAGYDVARLMVGSHGSLGVILSATFKLVPVAPASSTVRADLRRVADVVHLVERIRDEQHEPESIELRIIRGPDVPDLRAAALVRYTSVPPAVQVGVDATRRYLEAMDVRPMVLEGEAETQAWVDHERATRGSADVVLRASWRPAALVDAAAALTRATAGLGCEWTGRAAVGSGEIGLTGEDDALVDAIEALRASPAFDHVVVVRSSAALRKRIGVWRTSDARTALWRALKQALDPTGTLNAGRGPL